MRAKQFLCFKQNQNLGRRFGASKMHLWLLPPAASDSILSLAVVLLLLIHCLLLLPLFVSVNSILFKYKYIMIHTQNITFERDT